MTVKVVIVDDNPVARSYTVNDYIKCFYKKLNASSRAEAGCVGQQAGPGLTG